MISILLLLVFGSMLAEARRAVGNERAQRARGGIEPRRHLRDREGPEVVGHLGVATASLEDRGRDEPAERLQRGSEPCRARTSLNVAITRAGLE